MSFSQQWHQFISLLLLNCSLFCQKRTKKTAAIEQRETSKGDVLCNVIFKSTKKNTERERERLMHGINLYGVIALPIIKSGAWKLCASMLFCFLAVVRLVQCLDPSHFVPLFCFLAVVFRFIKWDKFHFGLTICIFCFFYQGILGKG